MQEMKGIGLWEEVEKQARIQQGVNETWSVTSIMLADGKAFYTLEQPKGTNKVSGHIEIPLIEEESV
jgi:hypothetical protein